MAEKKELKIKEEGKPDPNCTNCGGTGFVAIPTGQVRCTCQDK